MIIYRYQTVSINRSATPTNEFSDFKTEQKNPKKTKKIEKTILAQEMALPANAPQPLFWGIFRKLRNLGFEPPSSTFAHYLLYHFAPSPLVSKSGFRPTHIIPN